MTKIYCYVDESGQDTRGQLFVVSIVVTAQERELLLELCEHFEKVSRKGHRKWHSARYGARLEYMRLVLSDRNFKGVMCYSVFRDTRNYELATVTSVAKAICWQQPGHSYSAVVYIDGLSKTKQPEYGRELRRLGVLTHKVRGVAKEQNNTLTRLADALAGFVRDALTIDNAEVEELFEKGKRDGVLIEV